MPRFLPRVRQGQGRREDLRIHQSRSRYPRCPGAVRVRDLGTRPASASLRELFSRAVRGQRPAIRVERRQIPYWQERGWILQGNTYSGSYQTPYAAFQGSIEQERSGHIDFYLYNPPNEIRSHRHWTCFQHRGNDLYLVHMGRQPKDVSSGIITIERLITEAYEQ
jgi:hypothetical protein